MSSLPRIWALAPALLASWPPLPGFNSILWINVPTGILAIGNALPILISTSLPDSTTSPTCKSFGAKI